MKIKPSMWAIFVIVLLGTDRSANAEDPPGILQQRIGTWRIATTCKQIWPACSAQESAITGVISVKPPHYPRATPESQGLTSANLDAFGAEIEEWVSSDRVVGASLLIVKNRKTVYRKVWGWSDRENKLPMREDAIVNWRSMTKPVGGTAIQMLIDEGKLAPKDLVAKYLPSFKGPNSREITVQQLLTHYAGYSQGMPAGFQGWQATMPYQSALDLANHWGHTGPVNKSGVRFDYADANADTLAGLVESITGENCGKFIRERILVPLAMDDTFVRFAKDDARRLRIAARYGGGTGQWVKHWSTADGNYYPFPMFAQGLFGSADDYAKFLACWIDEGKTTRGERLISAEAVKRALQPVPVNTRPTSMPYTLDWGHMISLIRGNSGPDKDKIVGFGHGGSDGTMAVAFPEDDIIVIFFTQSRGNNVRGLYFNALVKYIISPRIQ